MVEEALGEAYKSLGAAEEGACVVACGEGWQPGIVGLVASRLKEFFGRPAFAIALSGEIGTGSARSISGVDLGKIVRAGVERGLLVKGGGHAMAAGVTVLRSKLDEFRDYLEQAMGEQVAQARKGAGLFVDGLLTASACTPDLVEEIEKAGPFGSGNPEPVFVLPEHKIIDVIPFGDGHLRIRVQAGDGAKLELAAFRAAQGPLGAALAKARNERAHLACTLSLDYWGGKPKVRARLVDLTLCRPGGGF